jgi:hypothetical protein
MSIRATENAIHAQSAPHVKIGLFRSLFRGRDDVFARRFESRKTAGPPSRENSPAGAVTASSAMTGSSQVSAEPASEEVLNGSTLWKELAEKRRECSTQKEKRDPRERFRKESDEPQTGNRDRTLGSSPEGRQGSAEEVFVEAVFEKELIAQVVAETLERGAFTAIPFGEPATFSPTTSSTT